MGLKTLKFSVLLYSTCFVSLLSYILISMESNMILELELFSISSTSFSVMLILDKISLSFGIVVTLISGSVFMFAHQYMSEDPFKTRFIWILLSFVISMNTLVFSGSVFMLFLGWDGLGITSFALIVYYQSYESLNAGFVTLMVNRIGDAIIVMAVILFALVGQFTFVSMSEKMISMVTVLSIAALTKSAQFPFSSWLPAAMAAPTPVSALVHSSTLVTAGIFLIIRLSHNIPLSEGVMSVLLICSAVTSLLGGWAATFENDIKKIIALSTLSQLGVMVFSLSLGLPNLALFHLYTHALFKALLFLGAGHILMVTFGTQDIRLLGGVGMSIPLTATMFNISSLCLVGAPFLSAFYSKHVILEKMFMTSSNMFGIFLMMAATIMTAKYVSRMLKSVSWSKTVSPTISASSSAFTTFPVLILSFGGIVGGKLFALAEVQNLESVFTFSILSTLINFITVLGLLWGVVGGASVLSNFPLSSLFYLTPLVSLSSKILSPISKKMVNLDYGWLEPSFLIKDKMHMMGSGFTTSFLWPSSLTILRMVLLTTIILFVTSYNF
uniref:NADH-ubiquinone oxidoreductase chain 5 n=1 Tax=Siphonaria pectinata TaxID=57642 RepID=Q6VAQ2_9GAST|nr:NADH dehydrogenase subunit 5 [Siphonaria pectinata]AAR21547.2 NADH dehydrogenase subunit 5 [Siphonaria pectinata]